VNGFDFTLHVRWLCEAIVADLPEFRHIDMERIAIRYCQTRKAVSHGLQASLTPLRFAGGARHEKRSGRTWTVQKILDPRGREMLYLLSFYLPRFLDLCPREKLVTVIHELWHIGTDFDGDLRRLPGRCYLHSHSEHEFDAAMDVLAQRWLARHPPAAESDLVRLGFRQLRRRYGAVYGLKIPAPKLLPVDSAAA